MYSYSTLGFNKYESVLLRVGPVALAIIGLIVLAAWVFDISSLKSIFPNAPTMKFSTAVSFVCSGVSLYFIIEHLSPKRGILSAASQVVLPAALLIVILLMSTHIASAILSKPSGLDNIFVREQAGGAFTYTPGRPSEGTIANFLLIATAGTVSIMQPQSLKKILLGLGIAIASIASVAIIGYLISAPTLYYAVIGVSNGMAIHTASLFLIAGLTLIMLSIRTKRSSETITTRHGLNGELPLENSRFVSVRTKLSGLFLVVSIVPILFVGGIALNNSSGSIPPEDVGGSIAVLGLATAISATIFALALSHSILKPLFALRYAMDEVANGNYQVKIPLASTDEIGALAKNFSVMKDALATASSNLERLVNVRTSELLQSKKHLEIVVGQLKEQERIMKEFISVAAHELKNPVTPILVTTQLLAKREVDMKITLSKEEFALIAQNAIKLKRLCEDILDVARIENNGIKLEKTRFDLSEILELTINDIKPMFRPGVEIVYNGSSLIIEADREKVQQVIQNLLQNAIKFTHEGKINVSMASNSDCEVVVRVEDSGNGIDPEILPRLFNKFVTKSEKGTGLGLFISKNITEAHGGRIWAENIPGGKGAIFAFSLPLEKLARANAKDINATSGTIGN